MSQKMNIWRNVGLRVRLSAAVAAAVFLTEFIVYWWHSTYPNLAWIEVLFRMCQVVVLVAFCWRLMGRPIERLQQAVAGGLRLNPSAFHAEWQLLVDTLQRAWLEQKDAVNQHRVFLTDASHQLRTPLAVLRAQLQGIQSGELVVNDTLPKMLATVDHSSEVVRQILSMAKVEQKVAQKDWHTVNLESVAREVCLECGPLIAKKSLDFSFEATPVQLHADVWMLGELLRNLMSNAIHHAPRGSPIGLVLRILPGQAEIIVWDNGGGIDETVRGRLFEPFQSASGSSGVGLGLSICRQIAQSMDAQINLYNRIQNDAVVGVDAVVRWPLSTGATT
jgi:signal transduction histidine kinase